MYALYISFENGAKVLIILPVRALLLHFVIIYPFSTITASVQMQNLYQYTSPHRLALPSTSVGKHHDTQILSTFDLTAEMWDAISSKTNRRIRQDHRKKINMYLITVVIGRLDNFAVY
jgi:hypothetical protein